MAPPWANAGAVQSATSNSRKARRNFPARFMAVSVPPESKNPSGIGEKEEIHDDEATDHGGHQHPAHQRRLKLQVHEVSNDQRRLNDRQRSEERRRGKEGT